MLSGYTEIAYELIDIDFGWTFKHNNMILVYTIHWLKTITLNYDVLFLRESYDENVYGLAWNSKTNKTHFQYPLKNTQMFDSAP